MWKVFGYKEINIFSRVTCSVIFLSLLQHREKVGLRVYGAPFQILEEKTPLKLEQTSVTSPPRFSLPSVMPFGKQQFSFVQNSPQHDTSSKEIIESTRRNAIQTEIPTHVFLMHRHPWQSKEWNKMTWSFHWIHMTFDLKTPSQVSWITCSFS